MKRLNTNFTFKASHNLCAGQSLTAIISNKHVIFHLICLLICRTREEIENTKHFSESVGGFSLSSLFIDDITPANKTHNAKCTI